MASADLVDKEPDYIRRRAMGPWEAHVREVFDRTVVIRRIPAEGLIVELGTARGRNFSRLCALFGPERCLGFDVVDDLGHPRIRTADVRRLGPADDVPIALGWNDLSDWEMSPASKRAGRAYLLRNIVVGGLYVDAGFTPGAPPPEALPEFEHVASDRGIELWRRVAGGPTVASVQTAGPHTPDPAWWQWLDRALQLAPVACRVADGPTWGADAGPGSCTAVFLRGAVALLGRLRASDSGTWLIGQVDSELGGSLVFAGPEPRAVALRGADGRSVALTLASREVLVAPPGVAVAGAGAPGRAAWRVGFVHQPPAKYIRDHAILER